MNAIIPVRITDTPEGVIRTVNARDLHASLGVNTELWHWVKRQIERARLVEGRDYLAVKKDVQVPHQGGWRTRTVVEYYLTLDAAKHIAMMSGTDKGFELREYFIRVEKEARAPRSFMPAFIRRFNENADRVGDGYFSVISELTIRLHGRLELAGYVMPDKTPDGRELQPEVSVGQTFTRWLKQHHPEHADEYTYYNHKTPHGEFPARQYKSCVMPLFLVFMGAVWIPQYAEKYFRERDPAALAYLPKLLPATQ